MSSEAEHGRTIRFEVDGEDVETDQTEPSPVQIMQLAGVDPSTHYLKEIQGQKQISYEDAPDVPIKIHNNQKFITNSKEPAPVSQS